MIIDKKKQLSLLRLFLFTFESISHHKFFALLAFVNITDRFKRNYDIHIPSVLVKTHSNKQY